MMSAHHLLHLPAGLGRGARALTARAGGSLGHLLLPVLDPGPCLGQAQAEGGLRRVPERVTGERAAASPLRQRSQLQQTGARGLDPGPVLAVGGEGAASPVAFATPWPWASGRTRLRAYGHEALCRPAQGREPRELFSREIPTIWGARALNEALWS